jgi:hypothetical protein
MQLPHKILPDLAWSFAEPLPTTFNTFLAELQSYGKSVNAPVTASELATRFPLSAMDIEYKYSARSSTGAWVDVPAIVRVRRPSPPTYAELLYELHAAAYDNLHDQDHSYFEGLGLIDKENEKGIPVYELYLGS